MQDVVSFLNTREWATLIWFAIAAVAFSFNKDIRQATGGLLKTALGPRLVAAFLIYGAYVAAGVWFWWKLGLWDGAELKTTLFWALFAAPGMVGRMIGQATPPQLLRGWLQDTIAITVVIELLAFTYTFPVWIEFFLVPSLAFLVGMLTVAKAEAKFKPVVTLLETMFTCFGLWLVIRGIWKIIANWSSFATLATARDIYTVPLLSFTLIPFLCAVFLYARYEQAFAPVRLYVDDRKLRDRAYALAMIAFNVRTPLLHRWTRRLAQVRPTTREELRGTIIAVLRGEARERQPPAVPEEKGWCPIAAGRFLADEGFQTGDYHESYGEWFSSAPLRPVTEGLLPHNMDYCVEGDEAVATRLRLRLCLNEPENRDAALEIFHRVGRTLLNAAAPAEQTEQALALFSDLSPFAADGPTATTLTRENFPNRSMNGYQLTLTLRRGERRERGMSNLMQSTARWAPFFNCP